MKYAGAAPPPGSKPAPGTSPLCQAAQRADEVKSSESRYFPETVHNLSGAFRRYWDQNGGLFIYGYPITEEFNAPSTGGKVYKQQYFERARFEYHPENTPPADVQLGLLGVWSTQGRTFSRGGQPGDAQVSFFPETGQSLGLFKGWWASNGGLAVFGFPISGEVEEKSPTDGKTYKVQYFERNRLEYHPENKGTQHEVLLGLLGTEYLAKQGCPK